MIEIKNYSEPEECALENNNVHPLIPKHPFRLLIVGSSGSGKTNLLLNLIYDYLAFDSLYLCAKDINEAKYAKLQENYTQFDSIDQKDLNTIAMKKYERKFLKQLFNKFKKEQVTFCSDLEDMTPVDDLSEHRNLIIFDDCIGIKDQSKINNFFLRGRKKNASIIYLSQSYYSTPLDIRKNCNYFIFFKLQPREIKQILREIDGSLDTQQFTWVYEKAIQKPYDFFMLDLVNPKIRYRRNFVPL